VTHDDATLNLRDVMTLVMTRVGPCCFLHGIIKYPLREIADFDIILFKFIEVYVWQ